MSDDRKIRTVEQCGFVNKCMASPQSYASSLSSYRTPSAKTVADHALAQLEAARAKDIALHEANLEAIERNKGTADRVRAFMEEIGMPKSWSERDTKSRARFPKNITRDAGWVGDIMRFIKTDDGFAYATSTYERLKRDYDAYAATAARETEQAELQRQRAAEAEREARKANIELARIVLRYELSDESTWDDVLDVLRTKDQRVDLALAMMATRGDWSEGPYRVRDAIDRFTIVTDEDKEIANDVIACLHDFCDGRVFRDTTWNYDRIMASVADQQLATDALMAYQRREA
ncbi:Uncharacterised protein [Burkholderia pseudomallei]|uniref:hypothetical protein n=1 Tax=Burkholderia pseudomallei TaxID=28450 RepID=UPI000F092D12|nr:hypothetical protein [Burkholderia pseudomallei]CAJ3096786.1 Uncharacterised protein [Burkholderia pseudomallei]CAJ7121281.1 Uncharacterised protein [Burkholderia pseudomallei]CAJ7848989.1 Uncharacterised protein [Burkholderia pseudomallei]CAJ8223250.1 Uncharacterised protein [Burkholderia pseudomallei]CAJ9603175.1 Uncharacterised protein [Burkholderia pseudomallei]